MAKAMFIIEDDKDKDGYVLLSTENAFRENPTEAQRLIQQLYRKFYTEISAIKEDKDNE